MTNDALRGVSPPIAARLFVIVLAAMSEARSAPAEPSQAGTVPPVISDQAAAPAELTQGSQSSTALTPIRRGTDPQSAPGERTRPSSLTSTLALLGLVLGGAYVALNVLRRRQNVGAAQNQAIDLLASCRLDGQSTLHLVQIGRRVLAVGSTAAGASTLAVIEDPEEVAQLIAMSGDRGRKSESPANSSTGAAVPGGRDSRRAERAWTTSLFSGSAGALPAQNAGSEGLAPPPVGLDRKKRPA